MMISLADEVQKAEQDVVLATMKGFISLGLDTGLYLGDDDPDLT